MGPFGVIPKLFRVEGYSERKAVPNGRPPQCAVEEAQILGHFRIALLGSRGQRNTPVTDVQAIVEIFKPHYSGIFNI